jgi:plastocyanin
MRTRRPSPAIAGVLAGLAGACGGGERAPARHGIEIRAFVFTPAAQAAHRGDSLVFVNHDGVPHTATADNGAWDTGPIAANGTKVIVIPANGASPYHCAIHPTMVGKIEGAE